jgi:hypothetical protein
MRASLQQKNGKTEMENIAAVHRLEQPAGAASTVTFAANDGSPDTNHCLRSRIQ